jgi:hypothetical protein
MTIDTPCFCYICGDGFTTIDMFQCLGNQKSASLRAKQKNIIADDERGYIGLCDNCFETEKFHIIAIIKKYGIFGLKNKPVFSLKEFNNNK